MWHSGTWTCVRLFYVYTVWLDTKSTVAVQADFDTPQLGSNITVTDQSHFDNGYLDIVAHLT